MIITESFAQKDCHNLYAYNSGTKVVKHIPNCQSKTRYHKKTIHAKVETTFSWVLVFKGNQSFGRIPFFVGIFTPNFLKCVHSFDGQPVVALEKSGFCANKTNAELFCRREVHKCQNEYKNSRLY